MTKRLPFPDPALLKPADSLEPALVHARRFYARALADLACSRDAAQSADAETWRLLFERVAHDAIWAVTELHRGVETKYFRQRFISEGVRNHWTAAPSRGHCAQGVEHEHVVVMRELKQQLAEATNEGNLFDVLSRAVACVVTRAEHDQLACQAKHLRGWNRYECAGIRVWDRHEQRWHPLATD